MKTVLLASSAILIAPMALAQSTLDGTWKVDNSQSALPKKPQVYLVKDGIYECKTCRTHFQVPADGKSHAVSGDPYYDAVSMTVIDARHFEDDRWKAGQVVTRDKFEISDDGKSMTDDGWDQSSGTEPTTYKGLLERVAKGPAGAELLSGSWTLTKVEGQSDNSTTFTMKTEGVMLTMTNPTGQSYTAKLDGTDAAYVGDPGQDTVSIKKVSPHVFTEIDNLKGKIIGTSTMKISKDGNKMTVVWKDLTHQNSGVTVFLKQ